VSNGENGRVDAEALLKGDPQALSLVTCAVEVAVRSFRFDDPTLVEDLVQEAMSRVFLNLAAKQFRGDSSLKTYACRVARYTCLEHVRRRRFEVELDAERLPCRERWSEPEESYLWTEEHLKNLERFAGLPPSCRELLKLVFVERLSYKEVALRLGISEGAIKTRVHRCRAAFRRSAGQAHPPRLGRWDRKVSR